MVYIILVGSLAFSYCPPSVFLWSNTDTFSSNFHQHNSQCVIVGDLGKVSGNSSFGSFVYGDIKAFRENLWFELKTTNFDGEENIYQIQLTVEQM